MYEKKSLLIYNTLEIDQSPRAPMEHSSRCPGYTVFFSPSARGSPPESSSHPMIIRVFIKTVPSQARKKDLSVCPSSES